MRNPRGAWHNLSHSVKYADYLGYLTPIAIFDCVPGDRINHKIHALIRTQPLLAPVMHEVDIDIHAYFTPDRLVWDDSEDFYTGGDDGTENPTRPTMAAPASTGYTVGSLADYFGLPTGVPDYIHDARPFRAHGLIFNEHYRDTQLQAPVVVSTASGLDTTTSRAMLRPAWKRDYFTKCRPEPQLGAEVIIPLTGDAPVMTDAVPGSGTGTGIVSVNSTVAGAPRNMLANATNVLLGSNNDAPTNALYTDLSAVTGIPIRELREAGAAQRFLENNNIFGGRYIEQLMARFGVLPQDFRLQRPEFLGAGSTKIQFSEVLATADTGNDNVGDMRGHGISIVGSNRYKYKVKEHGWIIVYMIMRPKTQYMQGLHRMWSRETKYDYLLPEFAAIGDQAVLNKELYVGSAAPNDPFGYTPIFEEYRTIPSRVAGEFRTTLDYWHMARKFSSEPALNSDFIACNPTNRIFPATNAAQVYVNCKHSIDAFRLIPKTPDYRLM